MTNTLHNYLLILILQLAKTLLTIIFPQFSSMLTHEIAEEHGVWLISDGEGLALKLPNLGKVMASLARQTAAQVTCDSERFPGDTSGLKQMYETIVGYCETTVAKDEPLLLAVMFPKGIRASAVNFQAGALIDKDGHLQVEPITASAKKQIDKAKRMDSAFVIIVEADGMDEQVGKEKKVDAGDETRRKRDALLKRMEIQLDDDDSQLSDNLTSGMAGLNLVEGELLFFCLFASPLKKYCSDDIFYVLLLQVKKKHPKEYPGI